MATATNPGAATPVEKVRFVKVVLHGDDVLDVEAVLRLL
jgi:hypothetical protein